LGASSPSLADLLHSWDLLSECVLSFIAFVVIALVSTGALRATWLTSIEGVPDAASEFTASSVLVYGMYFSALLATITLPLLAVYRRRARELVNNTYALPPDARVSADLVSSRDRLEGYLHLDVGILGNPLTAFSLFTPLITSGLALIIPELASK
jgi:hypothetical protein